MSFIIAACSANTKVTNAGRYSIKQDHGPVTSIDFSSSPDAVPRIENQKRGKMHYKVLGKRYHILPSSWGFTETGLASWYGNKFHGHDTANGETYDMYAMTAAHKHLLLPTYVRVTNLENNKVVIVRVNDRGPFHGDRVIDLSYAAASKLGYHEKGVAKVKIEAINPYSWTPQEEYKLRKERGLIGDSQYKKYASSSQLSIDAASSAKPVNVVDAKATEQDVMDRLFAIDLQMIPADKFTEESVETNLDDSDTKTTQIKPKPVLLAIEKPSDPQPLIKQNSTKYHVQIGAFSKKDNAQKIAMQIRQDIKQHNVFIEKTDNGKFYRVLMGPFDTKAVGLQAQEKANKLGFTNAFIRKN